MSDINDLPADWAIERALEESGFLLTTVADVKVSQAPYNIIAFARYIETKEEPPVDPLVEVIATALRDGSPFDEDDSHDYTAEATCILSAMKARGYEFTKIGEGA